MKRILFVDDEPNVLEGLRRMLRPRRAQWEMTFVSSGAEALAELDKTPFDVIVSDMRMPQMDGAALLARVQERHPGVVRLVLSGQTELQAAMLAVPVAHQFLTKPCDAVALEETVERSVALQELLADETLLTAVGTTKALPSLPATYAALTKALGDPDVGLEEVTRIVEKDVAMCAKVLHIASSGFFGRPRRIGSVPAAVGALGTRMLRDLVLTVEVFRSFGAAATVRGLSLEAVQAHALLSAGIARRILPDKTAAELAFMAAVLHDIGILVLATHLPGQLAQLLEAARHEHRPLHAVEAEQGVVTHAEIGAYLLGLWGMPFPIIEAVAHHHTPARVNQSQFGVLGATHVAHVLAHEVAGHAGEPAQEIDVAYLEGLGVADRLPAWRELAAEQAETLAAA
ncbi:MAG: response regulator [Candidatus Binatia bacterium]